ncbi:hypothetical protein Bca52824_003827 [Brassica carinata]|uniref:Uncharacterized protein n=1 Tax=Brassica carinata TaxID=52824 RepID=A0A8X8BF13_BRACI|nr:hypothetical protein Bca52824_003827 [Brassica carinata]
MAAIRRREGRGKSLGEWGRRRKRSAERDARPTRTATSPQTGPAPTLVPPPGAAFTAHPTRRVTGLSLPSLSLRGPLTSLSSLDQLRLLDLHDNRLNGTVSPLTNCTNLGLVYLAGNDISGEIPKEISSLKRMIRLDLSDNNIRGVIPRDSRVDPDFNDQAPGQRVNGSYPGFSQVSSLLELNVSYNELHGKVTDGVVKKFGELSFSGNEGLCGSDPLPDCSYTNDPESSDTDKIVPSNPTSLPHSPVVAGDRTIHHHRGLRAGAIAAVIGGGVAVIVLASFGFAFCCGRSDRGGGSKSASLESGFAGGEGKRRSSYGGGGGEEINKHEKQVEIGEKPIEYDKDLISQDYFRIDVRVVKDVR